MEKCHQHVVKSAPYLIKNKHAFEINNKPEIIQELNIILQKINDIVYNTHSIDALTKSIHDTNFPLSEVFRDFYQIITNYLTLPMCRQGDRDFANLFRNYLCEAGANKLVHLYHFIANIGLIKLGCTRIYLVDKSKKGQPLQNVISDDEFLMQHVLDPSYQISKSNVENCIRKKYSKTDLGNILIGRTLLSISRDFRKSIQDVCPKIYKNWSPRSKESHEKFEQWLGKLIHDVDLIINTLR